MANGQKIAIITHHLKLDPNARLDGDTTQGLPEGLFFYHSDHLGSSSVVTDSNGQEVTRIAYRPFGEIEPTRSTGTDTVIHKFTGQELDEESELYYYNARYYDPSLGRFMTADTIVSNWKNAQSFNRYSYVINNPIKYTDPTGHYPWSDTGNDDDERRDWAKEKQKECNTCGKKKNKPKLPFVAGTTLTFHFVLEPILPLLSSATKAAAVTAGVFVGGFVAAMTGFPNELGDGSIDGMGGPIPTKEEESEEKTEPGPGSTEGLTDKEGKIASALDIPISDVKDAIHEVKNDSMPRGGPKRNDDVMVNPETGDVYPKVPGGVGDVIGNIFDYLRIK